MPLSNYQFRFSLLGTVLAIIGLTIFSSLGTWQVFRAMEKQQLQEEMDVKSTLPIFQLDRNLADIETRKYLKVIAQGHFDDSNEILIDNMVQEGSAGYHVLTPFILKADNSVIMVNRGWVPVGRDRRILPTLSAPSKTISIQGTISPPRSKPPLLLGEPDIKSKVWLYFDTVQFKKKSGNDVLPVIILLDKTNQHGYTREWPKYEVKIGMHIGYAIQWYVFALIVLVTYIALNITKRKTDLI
jgi:surfeit locus 1 family protein